MDEDIKPIEPIKPTEQVQKVKSPKKILGGKVLFIILTLVLIGAAAGASYWWRDKTAKELEQKQTTDISSLHKTVTNLEKQLASEKAKNTKTVVSTVQTTCTPQSPDASVVSNIKASITSGNTAALEGYMASSVNVIIAASEGIGPSTPTQAVSSITNFISDATSPWNFGLSASILSSYGDGSYSQYFPSIAVVGKSANAKVISFSFDCNGKIDIVFLAASEKLLI